MNVINTKDVNLVSVEENVKRDSNPRGKALIENQNRSFDAFSSLR